MQEPVAEDEMGDSELLRTRIRLRIEELKTTPRAVSLDARLGETTVGDILRSRSKSTKIRTAAAIARALDVDLVYLIGAQDVPRLATIVEFKHNNPVPIVAAIAEAGSFRKAASVLMDKGASVGNVIAPRYAQGGECFAIRMRGNSMNAAKPHPILDGMIVLCVEMAGRAAEGGKTYLVRCTDDGGKTFELSVRKATVSRKQTELRCESTDQGHDEPLVIAHDRATTDTSHRIEILALVYGSMFLTDFIDAPAS